jgi:hypothetical protein
MLTYMFLNVTQMHFITLYTIQIFWKLQNSFQKGYKWKDYFLAIWLIIYIHYAYNLRPQVQVTCLGNYHAKKVKLSIEINVPIFFISI